MGGAWDQAADMPLPAQRLTFIFFLYKWMMSLFAMASLCARSASHLLTRESSSPSIAKAPHAQTVAR